MTIQQFGSEIKEHFSNANPNDLIDRVYLLAFNQVTIDLVAFEEWLSTVEGYDEDKSIEENVSDLFGDKASKFIEGLLG